MVPIFPRVHTVQCSGSRDENRNAELRKVVVESSDYIVIAAEEA